MSGRKQGLRQSHLIAQSIGTLWIIVFVDLCVLRDGGLDAQTLVVLALCELSTYLLAKRLAAFLRREPSVMHAPGRLGWLYA